MSTENNRCVILRKLMTILDNVLVNGVNNEMCERVVDLLDKYRGERETFDAPTMDDFFEGNNIQHRVLNAVMMDLNENLVLPFHLGMPVPAGTLFFALHEYQHRYHDEDDPLLVAGRSSLENQARNKIEDIICNDEWGPMQLAMSRVYQAALNKRLVEMAYQLIEVRQAIQDWMPDGYEKIFIDYK